MISPSPSSDSQTNFLLDKDQLFYDGACPLCSKEMRVLQKHKVRSLALVDIHSVSDWSQLPPKEHMLRKLHLRLKGGVWLRGLEANIYAWRGTRVAWLWRLLTLPGISFFANHAYEYWAERRFKNLQNNCSTGVCQR